MSCKRELYTRFSLDNKWIMPHGKTWIAYGKNIANKAESLGIIAWRVAAELVWFLYIYIQMIVVKDYHLIPKSVDMKHFYLFYTSQDKRSSV